MWRKTLTGLLIFFAVFSFVNISYATDVNSSVYEIIKPERQSYSSSEKVILINGKAPSGTEVTIDIYGTTDLTRRSFNLDRLPSEQDYILKATDKVISGNMGFFQKQLDLVRGINKIVINFGVVGVENKEFIVYTYDIVRTEFRVPYTRESRYAIMPLLQ